MIFEPEDNLLVASADVRLDFLKSACDVIEARFVCIVIDIILLSRNYNFLKSKIYARNTFFLKISELEKNATDSFDKILPSVYCN